MARKINRLTTKAMAAKLAPGRYADGDGLYLLIDGEGSRRWIFMFSRHGRRREMGLGSAGDVELPEARRKAAQARDLLAQGKDPIEEKKRPAPAAVPTLGVFAEEVIASLESGWIGKGTAASWRRTFTLYAAPIKDVPVDQVDTAAILRVLKPIWTKLSSTAGKVRERIERVLDAARAANHIAPPWENPARWKGHLAHLLPRRPKLVRGHHPAMPYQDVPDFMKRLAARKGVWARALEWTILEVAREDMALGARWQEVDEAVTIWTVPKDRMKGLKDTRREFRQPVSPQAANVLSQIRPPEYRETDFIFPGQKRDRPLSNAAMDQGLKKMGLAFVPHGFRTSFRDWAEEQTSFSSRLAEQCMAHVVGDETERSYLRGDVLEKRRALIEAWGRYCAGVTVAVAIAG